MNHIQAKKKGCFICDHCGRVIHFRSWWKKCICFTFVYWVSQNKECLFFCNECIEDYFGWVDYDRRLLITDHGKGKLYLIHYCAHGYIPPVEDNPGAGQTFVVNHANMFYNKLR